MNKWLVRRFILLVSAVSIFAFVGMIGVSVIKQGDSVLDMICVFLPTSFVLSSVCVFISLLGKPPHIPAMTVGVVWLFSLMAMSLLRFPPVRYFYLFARYETTVSYTDLCSITSMACDMHVGESLERNRHILLVPSYIEIRRCGE